MDKNKILDSLCENARNGFTENLNVLDQYKDEIISVAKNEGIIFEISHTSCVGLDRMYIYSINEEDGCEGDICNFELDNYYRAYDKSTVLIFCEYMGINISDKSYTLKFREIDDNNS